jgi:tetratricopeptide (TPR) repeat protein
VRAVLPMACTALFLQIPGVVAQTAPVASKSAVAAASHVGAANRLMQDRRYSEAAGEFERAITADPNDDNVRIQYATCLFLQERNDDARRQFEILRQRRGEWPGLQYYLGLLDFRANDFASAIRRLLPLKSDPAFTMASYYLGLAYQSTGQMASALENLERAARDNPRASQVHYRLGRAYSMSGRVEDADREYKLYRDLEESQRLAEDFGGACIDALRAQPIAQARPICQRIADSRSEDSNDSKRLTLLGQLYTQAGAFADAVPPLQRAVQLEPGSFDAWNYLGTSLFSLHRYQEALTPLRKAAELNPQFFDTLNLLAATLHDLGDDAAALPILERAHSLNPDDAAVTGALDKMRAAAKGTR